MNPRRVVVTGANGFVGRATVEHLAAAGWSVGAAVRTTAAADDLPVGCTHVVAPDLTTEADWRPVLDGAEAVVHLAARVHQLRDAVADPLAAYRAVNVEGTRRVAEAAAKAGATRFVLLSTAKAVADGGVGATAPLREDDPPRPTDPYGQSKLEAEQAATEIGKATGLEVVILRPPVVYGPGVKANILRLFQLVDRGVPLPLASVRNARSLLFVDNLAHAIRACLEKPRAAGRTYHVSDGPPISTPDLIRRIAAALDRRARLVPAPPALLAGLGRLAGHADEVDRLMGSLVVDTTCIRRELDWNTPFTLDQGLRSTAAWFRRRV